MKNEINSQDTANFLQWSGFAFLAVFGSTIIVDALPLALLQPGWLVRFSDKVLGGGALVLTGMVLLVLALRFDPKVIPLSRVQKRIRGVARLVALVFLLLIPLQTIAGIAILDDASRIIQGRLNQLQQATDLISIANNETELIQGLALLPNSPVAKGQRLSVPFAIVKTKALRELNRQMPLLQVRSEQMKKLRLERGIAQWFKQAVISAAYAMAFWTLGSVRNQALTQPGRQSPLLSLRMLPLLKNLRLGRRNRIEIPSQWMQSSNPADH